MGNKLHSALEIMRPHPLLWLCDFYFGASDGQANFSQKTIFSTLATKFSFQPKTKIFSTLAAKFSFQPKTTVFSTLATKFFLGYVIKHTLITIRILNGKIWIHSLLEKTVTFWLFFWPVGKRLFEIAAWKRYTYERYNTKRKLTVHYRVNIVHDH